MPRKERMKRMRKATPFTLSVLAAVLALSLMFTIPSGAITEEAQNRYFDALWEEDYEEDYEARLEPVAVLANAVFSDILPAANVASLDDDLFAPGSAPIAENFTENGYRDESMIVELEKRRMYDSDVYIAYIKVATPSQLRTAVAGNKLSSERTNFTTAMPDDLGNNTVGVYDWSAVDAVENQRVYKMPLGMYRSYTPGADTPVTLLWLAKTAYPDRFADIDIIAETKTYYSEVFGVELTDEQAASIFTPASDAGAGF